MISLCSKIYCAAEDADYCDCCACKNIECKIVNVLKNVNAISNFHAKAYKKQETI